MAPMEPKDNDDFPLVMPDMLAQVATDTAKTHLVRCTVRISLDYSRDGNGPARIPVELASRGTWTLPSNEFSGTYTLRASIDGVPVKTKAGFSQDGRKNGPSYDGWEVLYGQHLVGEGRHVITFTTSVAATKKMNTVSDVAQVHLCETHVYPIHVPGKRA